jgi:hypothetical protein
MTSEEIKQTPEDGRTVSGWLKELCYQMAVSNERIQPQQMQLDRAKPIFDRKVKQ